MTIPSKDHILKRLHPLLQAKPDDVRFSLRHLLLDLDRVEVTTSVVVPAESHRPHVTNLTQKAAFFSDVTGSPGRGGGGGSGRVVTWGSVCSSEPPSSAAPVSVDCRSSSTRDRPPPAAAPSVCTAPVCGTADKDRLDPPDEDSHLVGYLGVKKKKNLRFSACGQTDRVDLSP